MVPLVKGEWAEVKTLAIGVVERRLRDGVMQAHTGQISYFSRMADHMSFARASAVETHGGGRPERGRLGADLHCQRKARL
jgi:hypothetical protein